MGNTANPPADDELIPLDKITRQIAESSLARKDWSGLPIPVPGLDLVLEPRYKHKDIESFRWKVCYDEAGPRHASPDDPVRQPSGFKRVNSWWNSRYQANVI